MVLDGSLGYIGRVDEPTKIIFHNGRIEEIEDTPTGRRLKEYMEEYRDSRIYVAGEFGIGLNSSSKCEGNCYIEDESAYGTFHIGVGRNLALGGRQNANGHFDLVCHEPDIYTDNRQIMQQGKIIVPEPVPYSGRRTEMKVLITGFDPFGGETVNPAYEAVKLLPDTIAGAEIVKMEIPTVFSKSGPAVEAGIKNTIQML